MRNRLARSPDGVMQQTVQCERPAIGRLSATEMKRSGIEVRNRLARSPDGAMQQTAQTAERSK